MKYLVFVITAFLVGCSHPVVKPPKSDGHIEAAISYEKRIDDKAVIVQQYLSR